LQVLEPEFLDLGKTGTLDTGYIISGVEFDFVGRRQAYWIFPEHPGDTVKTSRFGNLFSRRIPASEIVHVYRKMRAPQVRGVPILAPVIVSIRDLDEYQDAERMRKKIEACLVAMFKQPLGPDGPTAGALATDAQGNKIEQFQPGMVMYGTPGMEADFFAPTGAGGYSEYVRQNERIIAAGVGLTYEKLTGDLTQVNYSSYRAGDMSFRRGVEQFNYNCFIPGCLKPIRRRFIDAAFAVGAIPELEYSTEWTPPAFGSVDPEKDANAAMVDMQIGRATWPQVVAEQGYDPHKQIEEIKKWKPELEAAGVTFTGGKNAGNNQNQVAKN
jgi:lambda family phage portal protein